MTHLGVRQHGPLRWVFTDRRGGVSRPPWDHLNLAEHVGDDPAAVSQNRRRAAAMLGCEDSAVVTAEHGRRVQVVDRPGPAEPGDAVITTRPGLALMGLAADCILIVMADPQASVLAVVHSGWRGVVADAAGAAADHAIGLGAAPERMFAAMGPSICPDCFEVSQDVADMLEEAEPGAAGLTRKGTPGADLPGAVQRQLARRGVAMTEIDGRCTVEEELLYSYRRQGHTGRHGVLAVLDDIR